MKLYELPGKLRVAAFPDSNCLDISAGYKRRKRKKDVFQGTLLRLVI
jgi:hypothetical protein